MKKVDYDKVNEALSQMDEGLTILFNRAKEAEQKGDQKAYQRIRAAYNQQSYYHSVFKQLLIHCLELNVKNAQITKILAQIIKLNQSVLQTEFNKPS